MTLKMRPPEGGGGEPAGAQSGLRGEMSPSGVAESHARPYDCQLLLSSLPSSRQGVTASERWLFQSAHS